MNLTHPPSSFASLEASVEQARPHVADWQGTLAQAAGTEPDLRELLRQLIPEWESQVQLQSPSFIGL